MNNDSSATWRLDKRIDSICDSFEALLQEGANPSIAALLNQIAPEVQHQLLRELLILQWHCHDVNHVPWSVDDYAAQFPEQEQVVRSTAGDYRKASKQNANELSDTATSMRRQRAVDPAGPTIGTHVGRYIIEEEIGAGGVGIVFRARQLRTDRQVALKFLNCPAASADRYQQLRQRFLREPKAVAQLDHPNIVPVYEAADFQERPFFSMKLIDGPSLRQLTRDGPVESRMSAQYVRDVAQAIEHAHQHDVLHRDLKPGNILVGSDGRPYVTDFGMAKLLAQDAELTDDGTGMGTVAYVAPEQAEDAAGADARSDVYGLGATLYCLLTGRPPFQAASQHETLRQVREVEPVPPRQLNDAIDRDLETICLKCLAKLPSHRYQAAHALAADLTRYLRNEPITARRPGYLARLKKWCQRNPSIASFAALFVTTLVVGSAVSLFFAIQARISSGQAAAATAAKSRELAISEDLRRKLYLSLADTLVQLGVNHGQSSPEEACLWFAVAAGSARTDDARFVANLRRLSSWNQITTQPISAFSIAPRRPATLVLHPSGDYMICADRDGRHDVWDIRTESMMQSHQTVLTGTVASWNHIGDRLLISDSAGTTVRLMDFPSLSLIWERKMPTAFAKVVFARRQPVIALAHQSAVDLLEAASGETITSIPVKHTYALALDHRDRNLLVGHRADSDSRDGLISTFAMSDLRGGVELDNQSISRQAIGQRLDLRRKPLDRMGPMFIGQTSHYIFAHDQALSVQIHDATGKQPFRECSIPKEQRFSALGIRGLAVAAAKNVVALYGYKHTIVFDTETFELKAVVNHRDGLGAAALDSSGTMLLTGSGDRDAKMTDLKGGRMIDVISHQAGVDAVSLLLENRLLATAQTDGLIRVWRMPISQPNVKVPAGVGFNGTRVAMTSSRQHFIPHRWVGGRDRTYGVVSSATGEIVEAKTVGPQLAGAAFSPDDRYLVTLSSDRSASAFHAPGTQRGRILIWDRREQAMIEQREQIDSAPIDVAFISDDECVVLCADGELLGLDMLGNRRLLGSVVGRPYTRHVGAQPLKWNPAKELLAVSCCDGVQVYDSRGKLLRHLARGRLCDSADFTSDGQILCSTGFHGGVARIWNCQSWALLASLEHSDKLLNSRFSADGTRVVTACRDRSANIWDWRHQRTLVSVAASDVVTDACLVAGDTLLVTGSIDGVVRFWDPRTGLPVSPEYHLHRKVHQVQEIAPGKVIVAGPGVHIIDVPQVFPLTNDDIDTTPWELSSGKKLLDPSSGQSRYFSSPEWIEMWRQWTRPKSSSATQPR